MGIPSYKDVSKLSGNAAMECAVVSSHEDTVSEGQMRGQCQRGHLERGGRAMQMLATTKGKSTNAQVTETACIDA